MTRIGVMSDSHGRKENVQKALEEMRTCDVIVHLGDHAQDAFGFERDVIKINGNCDWFSDEPVSKVLMVENTNIYLTHGHRENVKMGLMRLFYKAAEEDVRLALYGHTHIPSAVEKDGILMVNPGALKDGNYALIEIENGKIRVEHKRLD